MITINGTAGDDFIFGTAADETILGLNGDDTLQGLDGNDLLNGGAGNDFLIDGSLNDTYIGGAGDDFINHFSTSAATIVYSGNRADYQITFDYTLNSLIVTDSVKGRDGTDQVAVSSSSIFQFADATVSASSANYATPQVFGTNGDDTLIGSTASDEIQGLGGNDSIAGGGGNDELVGNSGNDTIDGGAGNDFLLGNGGNDVLIGGLGDDNIVVGGAGNTILNGGNGTDAVSFAFSGAPDLHIDLTTNQTQNTGFGFDQFLSIEDVFADAGNDVLIGNEQDNRLSGWTGDDTLLGGGGDDKLYGGKGRDVLEGGRGNDLLTGEDGSDLFLFASQANQRNIDVIADFNAALDFIALDHTIFSNLATGSVAPEAFQIGPSSIAASADVRIIFDSGTGALFYDADGDGGAHAAQFATISLVGLSGTVAAADFMVL